MSDNGSTNISCEKDSVNYDVGLTATRTALGSLAIFMNALIATVIFTHKSLRSKTFYFLCAQLAVADLLVGVSFMVVSSIRLSVIFMKQNATCSLYFRRAYCLSMTVPTSFTVLLSSTFSMVTAVDRFVAVFRPIFYRRVKTIYLPMMCLAPWLFAALDLTILFTTILGTYDDLMNICTIAGTYSLVYQKWSAASQLTIVFSGMVLSTAALWIIRTKLMSHSDQPSAEIQSSTITIAVVTVVTTILQFTARIGFIAISNFALQDRVAWTEYFRVVLVLNSCVNLFIYMVRMSEFRHILLHWIGLAGHSSRVTSTGGGATIHTATTATATLATATTATATTPRNLHGNMS